MTAVSEATASGGSVGAVSASRRSKARYPGLESWGLTDVGRERDVNEDAIYPDPVGSNRFYQPPPEILARKGQLLLVADGIGGEQIGSAASQWAIRLAAERYYELPGDDIVADLREALHHANAALYRYLQSTGVSQAGSTMAAAVVHEATLYIANVGDSRVYLLRDGVLYQQTRDHTLAQQKADRGAITQAQVAEDPDATVLTRALGAAPSVVVDMFRPLPLAVGDMVLLCSDGLYDMVPDAEITRLALSAAPRRAVERLIEAANLQGGYDNIAVIVARLGGGAAAAPALPSTGYIATLREDLARLTPSQRRTLLLGMLIIALIVFVLAFWFGWHLYAPAAPTAAGPAALPAAMSPLSALISVAKGRL